MSVGVMDADFNEIFFKKKGKKSGKHKNGVAYSVAYTQATQVACGVSV
jgi:hypothetical protein